MKTIGYIDYYLDEWHAHHGFETVKAYNEKYGKDFAITAVWAETDKDGGMTTDGFCAKYGVKKCATIAELASQVEYPFARQQREKVGVCQGSVCLRKKSVYR